MISVVQAFIARFAAQKTKSFFDYEGKVYKVVEPGREWRISYRGGYWTARSRSRADFRVGDRVRVVEQDRMTLIIEPLESEEYV
jgi:membrane protein implicated in regulation of membrane protease activity